MRYLLKNGHLVDPQIGLDEVADLLIEDEIIAQVGAGIVADDAEVIDCEGKYVFPGLIDVHVHLREPGYEAKEDIESGTRAAVKGGFTGVCAMPNTDPVCDCAMVIKYIASRSRELGFCKVYTSGACTKGELGEEMSEMGDMVAHGAVAFTDDGRGVQNAGMMRRVLAYASQFDKTVMSHCQDESLVGSGQINEGSVSTLLGLAGWPAAGEEIQIGRDIALARLTGARLHLQHVSTAAGMELIRSAKEEGLRVTCEVTPHHLFLNENCLDETYNTSFKVNPPLRSAADNEALIDAVADGLVDVIATDHAPHTEYEKDREFERAPFGMVGLETAVGLVITNLVRTRRIDWQRFVELLAVNPRKILSLAPLTLEEGSTADITVIDPDVKWTVDAQEFASKAHNTGFAGAELTGRASEVFVDGALRLCEGALVERGTKR